MIYAIVNIQFRLVRVRSVNYAIVNILGVDSTPAFFGKKHPQIFNLQFRHVRVRS